MEKKKQDCERFRELFENKEFDKIVEEGLIEDSSQIESNVDIETGGTGGDDMETETGMGDEMKTETEEEMVNDCGEGYIMNFNGKCVPLCDSEDCIAILKNYSRESTLFSRLPQREIEKIEQLLKSVKQRYPNTSQFNKISNLYVSPPSQRSLSQKSTSLKGQRLIGSKSLSKRLSENIFANNSLPSQTSGSGMKLNQSQSGNLGNLFSQDDEPFTGPSKRFSQKSNLSGSFKPKTSNISDEYVDPFTQPTSKRSDEYVDPFAQPTSKRSDEYVDPFAQPTSKRSDEYVDPFAQPTSKRSDEPVFDIFKQPSKTSKNSDKFVDFFAKSTSRASDPFLNTFTQTDENILFTRPQSFISEPPQTPAFKLSNSNSKDINKCIRLLKEENKRRKQNNQQLISLSDGVFDVSRPVSDVILQQQINKISSGLQQLSNSIKSTRGVLKECKSNQIRSPFNNRCIPLSDRKNSDFYTKIAPGLKKDENFLYDIISDNDKRKTCDYLKTNTFYKTQKIAEAGCEPYLTKQQSFSRHSSLKPSDIQKLNKTISKLSEMGITGARESRSRSRSMYDGNSYALFKKNYGLEDSDIYANKTKKNCKEDQINNPKTGFCIKYEDKKSSTFNNVLKDYILNEDCEMYRNAFNENDKRKLKKKYKSLDRC